MIQAEDRLSWLKDIVEGLDKISKENKRNVRHQQKTKYWNYKHKREISSQWHKPDFQQDYRWKLPQTQKTLIQL